LGHFFYSTLSEATVGFWFSIDPFPRVSFSFSLAGTLNISFSPSHILFFPARRTGWCCVRPSVHPVSGDFLPAPEFPIRLFSCPPACLRRSQCHTCLRVDPGPFSKVPTLRLARTIYRLSTGPIRVVLSVTPVFNLMLSCQVFFVLVFLFPNGPSKTNNFLAGST